MNTIILSALSGIILMFSGFFIKSSRALSILTAFLFLGIIIGGIFQISGCQILANHYPNMIESSLYGDSFVIGLAALAIFYLLINKDLFGNVGKHVAEYFALILFSFCGITVLAQFNNLVLMFIGIELLSIPMYIIAGTNKESLKSTEASVKYFLMGSFSTGFLLLGITLIYGATGSFLIQNIGQFDPNFELIYYLGWVLIIFSFCFKVGTAPFHMWTPDIYAGTPTVFTSYMSTIVKGGSFLGFILILQHFPADPIYGKYLRILLGAMIVLTLVIGNLGAVTQKSVKKMMAYSSIAQAGFILFVLYNINSVAKEALFFYIIVYSVSNFIIFYTIQQTKAEKYEDFIGLSKNNPTLAATTSVALISLAGIPLTGGFIAKFMALSIGGAIADTIIIIIIALVMAVLSMYYYFKVIVYMYFIKGSSKIKKTDSLSLALLIIGVVIIIIMGVFPSILPSFLATPMW